MPGVMAGEDILYWFRVMQFAASLVTRQKYLPGIKQDHGEHVACWKPVYLGEDRKRFEVLTQAMPPICRALDYDGVQECAPTRDVQCETILTLLCR